MPFEPIIADAELWDGDMTARRVDGHDLLLVRHNGVVYAYENRCAHQGVALSEGRLDGYILTCRAHHWQYDVRSGSGVNPATACLRRFAVKIEDGKVFVDVHAPSPDLPNVEDVGDGVGPVLTGHPRAQAVLEAIRRLNPSIEIQNRGSYIRVLAPRRCLVTRSAIEDILRQPFDFRAELEIMMPSFKGRMRLDDDEAVWTFEDSAISGATASPTWRSHPEMIPNAMPSFKDTVRGSDDEVVSTFEASAISGATASPTGRSRQETGQKRTYWHLSDLGRKPTDYDIATSRLHYWTARGFEVKVPVSEWYERYQRGSELRCRDWEEWGDPRQTTYTTYTTMQRTREAFVNGLLDSIGDDYDRGLSPQCVSLARPCTRPPSISRSRLANGRSLRREHGPDRTYHHRRHLPGCGRNAARPAARIPDASVAGNSSRLRAYGATDLAGRPDLATAARSHRNAPGYMGLGRSPRCTPVRAEARLRRAVHDACSGDLPAQPATMCWIACSFL